MKWSESIETAPTYIVWFWIGWTKLVFTLDAKIHMPNSNMTHIWIVCLNFIFYMNKYKYKKSNNDDT